MRRLRHRAMVALRRLFSRPQWAIRLFDLSERVDTPGPGLVLIQIDGLSRHEMERAVAAGRLPHLRKLLQREGYGLSTFYSGIPSSTPAVQGELFYGVRGAVPAFGFRDRGENVERSMLSGDSARAVEARLAAQAEGLLSGGAAYSDIYTGGAAEAHYCAASISSSNRRRLLAWWFMALLHLPALIRALALTVFEVVLAVADMVRGVTRHQNLWQELRFVPARVAVCLLLREVIAFGIRVDMARGLPIIHANFLGFDEQAHRRGPRSRFAHWTLRGIDAAIGRILKTAHGSSARPYQVWVYSDHGQEAVIPYGRLTGEDIHAVVAAVTGRVLEQPQVPDRPDGHTHRIQLTGWRWIERLGPQAHGGAGAAPPEGENWIITKGPVGHVYFPAPVTAAQRLQIARELVQRQVPAVLLRDADGGPLICGRDGTHPLAAYAPILAAARGPTADWLRQDVLSLAEHPDAGDLVLLGWYPGVKQPVSFPDENGAHGSIGPTETCGFAVLPTAALPGPWPEAIRPSILRQAALRYLGRAATERPAGAPAAPAVHTRRDPTRLRLVTWNVHSCGGADGIIDPRRVAAALQAMHPDIVCLQEVDDCPTLPELRGQLAIVAERLGMVAVWHPISEWGERRYGLGVLARWEPAEARLIHYAPHGRRERRGLIRVSYHLDGEPLHVVNTHWGLRRAERLAQARTLMGPDGIGDLPPDEALVVCGDLNCTVGGVAYRHLAGALRNAWDDEPDHSPRPTFPALVPVRRIDHILVNDRLRAAQLRVPRAGQIRYASDHLPVLAELSLAARVGDLGAPRSTTRQPRSEPAVPPSDLTSRQAARLREACDA